MDNSDERKKKLEAGKEKLAAFRKKKAKSKKSGKDKEENLNTLQTDELVKDDTTNSSDVFMTDYIQSVQNEPDCKSVLPCESNVLGIQEVSVSEEAPENVLSSLGPQPTVDENTNSNNGMKVDGFRGDDVHVDAELFNFETALSQRDMLIGQLTNSLQSNVDQQAEKEDLVSQVLNLAQNVTLLQSQLKEADQALQDQLHFHGISTSALQSAKTQMQQLQSIVHAKDEQLLLASQQLEQNCESLRQTKDENVGLSQRLKEKGEELENLQSCYDSAVSSHVEKQEKEESEKSNQLYEFQNQWKSREDEMRAVVDRQAKELHDWENSGKEWKERESHLISCLQEENLKNGILKDLELELEGLRRDNELMKEEVFQLKGDKLHQEEIHKSCVTNLEALTNDHNHLSFTHSNLLNEFQTKNSSLEESLQQLTLENEGMRSKLEELTSHLELEREKVKSTDKHVEDVGSKHSAECDKLNNKINELQSTLSAAHESLAVAENALREEKVNMEAMQQEVSAKEAALSSMTEELSQLSSKNSDLHTQLMSKEVQIQEMENLLAEKSSEDAELQNKQVGLEQDRSKLEGYVATLTGEFQEIKYELEKSKEQIINLQKENVLAIKKADELNDEFEKRNKNASYETERSKTIESQLHTVEEERNALHESIKGLNNEICVLKDDLDNKTTQLDILGEEMVSVNSKLVETENSLHHNLLKMKQSEVEKVKEVEKCESRITELVEDVEKISDQSYELDLKLESSTEAFEKLTDEFKELSIDLENARENEKQSNLRVKDLEDEVEVYENKCQEMTEREKEHLHTQEEMHSQLESTVNQWQKLQLIVQEKEIELQNLHEDLDEQKRICTTLKKNHQENINSVSSDFDLLKEAKESNEARVEELEGSLTEAKESNEAHVQELEGLLTGLQSSLDAKEEELSDNVSKIQAMDSSIQDLSLRFSEKEKELDDNTSECGKLNTQLTRRKEEVANLKENLLKANDETAKVIGDLNKAKAEISVLENDLKAEREGKESRVNEQQEKLSQEEAVRMKLESQLDKEQQQRNRLHGILSSVSQDIEMKEESLIMTEALLNVKMTETSQMEHDLLETTKDMKKVKEDMITLKTNLDVANNDKELLKQELECKDKQLEEMSVNMDDLVSQKDDDLLEVTKNLEISQEELKKAKEDISTFETNLNVANDDKESLNHELESKSKQLEELSANRDELVSQIQLLEDNMGKMEIDFGKHHADADDLKLQLTELEASCSEKEQLLVDEQKTSVQLSNQLDIEKQQRIRLGGLLSSLSQDLEDKDTYVLEQSSLCDERLSEISRINAMLNEKETLLKDFEDSNIKLLAKIEDLSSREKNLNSELTEIRKQAEKLECDIAELSRENNELRQDLSGREQDFKKKEAVISHLEQDYEIILKECSDLREDIKEKDGKNLCLIKELESMTVTLSASNEEKEMLKSNFDACLEEMQQKLSSQDIEMSRWKSQLVEETRNKHEDLGDLKVMYNQQLAQMEEKVYAAEKEKNQVEKEMKESCTKLDMIKDNYEQQLAEYELNVQTAQSEVMKLNDYISKSKTDHEKDLKDLKAVHELHASELMENYVTLERSMVELQKTLSEQAESTMQERNEMEQSFESLMAEMDERKRRSDSDISRLKKHQEEMIKDHETELKAVEKKYETQLFDLEDRCSVMVSEMDRRRKSMVGVEGNFGEERISLENKIEDLENVRRELEIKCTILEDDISHLKEESNIREEEVKTILKEAAEKQTQMKSETQDLSNELEVWKMKNKSSDESLRKQFESRIDDLNAENRHLKNRLKSFEVNAEMDTEFKDEVTDNGDIDVSNSRLEEMKKQMAAMAEENLSLKRRLLGHKSLEKKVRMLSGVEEICPPLQESSFEEIVLPSQMTLLTSTPSKKGRTDNESFSPTAEEVSLIQGFVSESDKKPLNYENLCADRSIDEEPDFVAEKNDRFQPETVIENAVEDFDNQMMRSNMHPISDTVMTEGFQPEVSDQFFMEITDDTDNCWPVEQLSVGKSPTSKHAPLTFSSFEEDVPDKQEIQQIQVQSHNKETNSPVTLQNEDVKKLNSDEVDKQIKQMKQDLEEHYVFELRKQRQDIVIEYETKYENAQRELEQHFAQKEQSVRNDWEKKFVKALKKMKKDFEKKLQKHQNTQSPNKKQLKSDLAVAKDGQVDQEEDGMADIEEGSEELGEVVEQLSKENQELAEVRDELLKQIEISQTRGLHDRVQHELQSMLSERERENPLSSENVPVDDILVEEDFVKTESVQLCAERSGNVDLDADSRSRNNSVAAERFLEELEDMSQPSSQDLPLEWELTDTIPAVETDIPNNEAGHHSVWEVFGNRCGKQDCQEVRHRYRRLCQCVIKSFGIGEDLMSEESGLVGPQDSEADLDLEDRAKGVRIFSPWKGDGNVDNPEDDDLDDLFADNVALESELLSLAENMVFYREAFIKKKYELEKENEFLRLELETECCSRKDVEERFAQGREEMLAQIHHLEIQLDNVKSMTVCDKEMMTDPEMILASTDKEVMTDLEMDINSQGKEKEEIIAKMDVEVNQARADQENARKMIQDKDITIELLENEIAGMRDVNISMQSVCAKSANLVKNSESEVSRLTSHLQNVSQEEQNLSLKAVEQDGMISKLEAEIEDLKIQVQHLDQETSSKDGKLNALEDEVLTLKADNHNIKVTLEVKEEALAKAKLDKDGLGIQLQNLTSELQMLREDCSKLEDKEVMTDPEPTINSYDKEVMTDREIHIKSCDKQVMTDEEVEVNSYDVEVMTDQSCSDKEFSKLEFQERLNEVLEDKEESVARLHLDIENLKCEFEKTTSNFKENVESNCKRLEDEIVGLKIENNYLCLTHEGKEETITRLQTEIDLLKAKYDDLAERLSSRESDVAALESKFVIIDVENRDLQSSLEEKKKAISNLDENVTQLKAEMEGISKHLSLKSNECVTLAEQNDSLKKEKSDFQSVVREKDDKIINLDKEISELKSELNTTSKSLSEKDSSLETFDKETSELKDKHSNLQSVLRVKDEEIMSLNTDVQNLTTQLAEEVKNSSEKGMKLEALESLYSSVREENNEFHSLLEEKEVIIARIDVEVNQVRADQENARKVIQDKDITIELLENEIAGIRDANISMQSVCAKSANLVKNSESEVSRLTSHLQNVSQEEENLSMKAVEQEGIISKLEAEIKDLKIQVQHLDQETSSKDGKLNALEDEVLTLKTDNHNIKVTLEVKEEALAKEKVDKDGLESQLQNLTSKLQTLQEDYSKLEDDLCLLKGENDSFMSSNEGKLNALENEVSTLKVDHGNMRASLEVTEETLAKAELEKDRLKAQLQDCSSKLQTLQDNKCELEDELHTLRGEHDSLIFDRDEKVQIISKLEVEIDELETQLKRECHEKAKDLKKSELCMEDVVAGQEKAEDDFVICPEEAEIVCESISSTEQIPTKTFEHKNNDESSETRSEVNESVCAAMVTPLTSSLFVSTSSIPSKERYEESPTSSSFNVDQNSGKCSPAEIQDQALAEELNQLKKDLRETKAIYSRENSLLHEALEREKRIKEFVLNKNDSEDNAAGTSEGENEERNKLETGVQDMVQRLEVCLEQNKMLEGENNKLRAKIRKQEAVVLIYKHRLSEKEHDSELWRKSLTSQLQALQKQRDDLVQLLRNQEMGSSPTISEAIGQAALKEESLRRVQDDLMEKMEELDHLHQMLTQRQVELQHCDMERRHLEQLCLLKDQTEMQLMKQKRLMEEQVSEIEHRLCEREANLTEEKMKLMEELKEKDERLLQMSAPQSPRSLPSTPNRSCSMGDLRSISIGSASVGGDLNCLPEEADKQHIKAIETLREKLRLEYNVRNSRLAESQASAVASYWMRHQNKND